MKDIVFCTFITNNYKNTKVEFDLFYKSFKFFNSGVELVVFEDLDVKKIFSKDASTSSINWKCALAKELYNDYRIVVVLDSDHFIFHRLDEILEQDYDVAVPTNLNMMQNIKIDLLTTSDDGSHNYLTPFVPYDEYYQGGLVCGNKNFWNAYEFACKKHANSNVFGENNVLNMLLSISPFNLKILDGDKNFSSENFKCFYNCSSLNLEKDFIVKNDKIYCKEKIVKAYHVARGTGKIRFDNLFNEDVKTWFYKKIGKYEI